MNCSYSIDQSVPAVSMVCSRSIERCSYSNDRRVRGPIFPPSLNQFLPSISQKASICRLARSVGARVPYGIDTEGTNLFLNAQQQARNEIECECAIAASAVTLILRGITVDPPARKCPATVPDRFKAQGEDLKACAATVDI